MNAPRLLAALVVGTGLLFSATIARAESAQEAFDKGQALMKAGSYDEAAKWLGIAAKADATNEEYVKRYTVARKVADYRARLANKDTDAKQWEAIAKALRSFYIRENNMSEALAISQQMHDKIDTTASAVALAEVQLAMDQNEDGVKTLRAIDPSEASVASQALLALALNESGKKEQAKRILETLTIPEKTSPGQIYLAARAHAALGDSAKAMEVLTKLFESVPPAELNAMKESAKKMPEFASFVSTPEFAKVLETQSKVTESSCTGGSDCSSCPVGTKCPSAGGAEK